MDAIRQKFRDHVAAREHAVLADRPTSFHMTETGSAFANPFLEAEFKAFADGYRVATEWSYDLTAIGDEPVEVAFDCGLGVFNVQICTRRAAPTTPEQRNSAHAQQRDYGYFREGSDVDLYGAGWRPYAWRKVPVVPPLRR